ncbi:hypothetical protein FQN60_014554 [Etheostoma spectabile]|uniref:Uncharacterized protein n=1 Tax=Etheostoma spectabile TaxID=54343 RepID=A0A5J5DC50_9PERO|nr:hypothetical protein FQN60_014554 [Etheostoma spectabile]
MSAVVTLPLMPDLVFVFGPPRSFVLPPRSSKCRPGFLPLAAVAGVTSWLFPTNLVVLKEWSWTVCRTICPEHPKTNI